MDMMQPPPPPQQAIQPDALLNAALQAQEWNVVLGALNELPMRIARPLFDKLVNQLNASGS